MRCSIYNIEIRQPVRVKNEYANRADAHTHGLTDAHTHGLTDALTHGLTGVPTHGLTDVLTY